MVYFVGAGPGAPDLLTIRGAELLKTADRIIYAGSLVNPALLDMRKEGCDIFNSAEMTLEEVIARIQETEEKGGMTVRLHTGDPSLYSAMREQMDILDEKGISYEVCPGVSAFSGAAAALDLVYTLPGPGPRGGRRFRSGRISVRWRLTGPPSCCSSAPV